MSKYKLNLDAFDEPALGFKGSHISFDEPALGFEDPSFGYDAGELRQLLAEIAEKTLVARAKLDGTTLNLAIDGLKQPVRLIIDQRQDFSRIKAIVEYQPRIKVHSQVTLDSRETPQLVLLP